MKWRVQSSCFERSYVLEIGLRLILRRIVVGYASPITWRLSAGDRGRLLKRVVASASIVAVLAVSAMTMQSNSVHATTAFQLTVRNVTARQPITPPVVVVHDANTVLLPAAAERLPGLEALAESGAQPDFIESISERTGVKEVKRFGGIIEPGESVTILNVNAEPGDHVSVVGMLACTNDAIAVGSVVVTEFGAPAFGSGIALDAGTEENDETRATVPCLDGVGVSAGDTHDGEGTIEPHPGIAGVGDLGEVFGWQGEVLHMILDDPGNVARQYVDVGITLHNRTNGQPIAPPVVFVHDPNVNMLSYARPAELDGIDELSEGGINGRLIDTLTGAPGVVSVSQWDTGGPVPPGTAHRSNVRAIDGAAITVIGMFACTNDAYIVASAEVVGGDGLVHETSGIASVFDSGSEDNEETSETVPCLGGADAALSEGFGENERMEHPGITGVGDLDPAIHGWRADATAELSISAAIDESEGVRVAPQLPRTGGNAPNAIWVLFGLAGAIIVGTGGGVVLFAMRR